MHLLILAGQRSHLNNTTIDPICIFCAAALLWLLCGTAVQQGPPKSGLAWTRFIEAASHPAPSVMLSIIRPTNPCDCSAASTIRSRPEGELSQGVVHGHSSSVTFRKHSRRTPLCLTIVHTAYKVLHRLDEFSIPEGYASLSIMAPLDINWKQLPVQSEWTYSGCGISSQLTMNARSFTL